MQMVMIDKAVIEQALAALVRSEVMHGQPNFDIQKNLREALAQPQPVQQAPVGWPAGSVQLHTSLLYMGKAMAKERSREIGDAWNQLADLLYLLSIGSYRTASTAGDCRTDLGERRHHVVER